MKEEVVYEEIKADYKPVPKDPVIAEVEEIFEENKEEGIQNFNSQENDFPEDDEAINPELFTEHVPLVGRIPISKFCFKLLMTFEFSVLPSKRPGVSNSQAQNRAKRRTCCRVT